MYRCAKKTWLAAVGAAIAMTVAACGGSDATATPVPPTATRVPSPTLPATAVSSTGSPAPAAATPTGPVPTATSAPAATPTGSAATTTTVPVPTPTPSTNVPTPVVVPGARNGGTLQLAMSTSSIIFSDTFSSRGGVVSYSLMLNNLIWQDPYGDGKTIVGDGAEGWTFSDGGKVLTFRLRKGIAFHDGKPLTSKDVAYNIDRGWKPRSPTMNEFRGKLDIITSIETPDDSTVRLNLSKPSNFLLVALALSPFLVYPAHFPFPEAEPQWRAGPVGSGPFKHKVTVKDTRIETVRNDKYWKTGLPHVDAVTLNAINDDALIVSSYRAGKIDATSLEFTPLQPSIIDGILQKEQGFVAQKAYTAVGMLTNNKEPWTNPAVREALDLAVNRQEIVAVGYSGLGNAFAPPMMPPELGGQWGYSTEVMAKRPGYRADKAQDVARAKQLLLESGIDPSKVPTRILTTTALTAAGEALEGGIRAIGFKTELVVKAAAASQEALVARDFDLALESLSVQADDPLDVLSGYAASNGSRNYGKWSDPTVDRLLDEQDSTLDIAKRAQLLKDVQARVLEDRYVQMLLWRWVYVGANGYVKSYVTTGLPFIFGSRFRWEQVWLNR